MLTVHVTTAIRKCRAQVSQHSYSSRFAKDKVCNEDSQISRTEGHVLLAADAENATTNIILPIILIKTTRT